MAMASPTLLVKVTALQMVGAFWLVIVGIIDRVQAVDRVTVFPMPFIFMPLWTGILVSSRQQLWSMLILLDVSVGNNYPFNDNRFERSRFKKRFDSINKHYSANFYFC